ASRLMWRDLPQVLRSVGARWRGVLAQTSRSAAAPWRAPGRTGGAANLAWRAQLARAARGVRFRWWHPGQQRRGWRIPWGLAPLVPWVVRPPEPPVPPGPEPEFPPGDRVGLNLGCPTVGVRGLAPLNLGVTACYAVRPQRRTYI